MSLWRFSYRYTCRCVLLPLLIVLLFLPISSEANDTRQQWIDELAGHFMTIATGREYLADSRSYVIGKWRPDEIITYLIIGQADQEQREIVRKHLADLTRLTGLAFRDVSMEPINVSPNQLALAQPQHLRELLHGFRFPDPSWGYARQGQHEVPGLVTDHLAGC